MAQPPTDTAAAAWIFQGNPDRFDIDGYLAAHRDIFWLVKQHGGLMRPGQTIYIWRNKGKGTKAVAGIVARGVLIDRPIERAERLEAMAWWKDPEEARVVAPRVAIKIDDVATAKRVIRSDWLRKDPVCADLPNLKMMQGTNYPVRPDHAKRLADLWSRTGSDFDRRDLLLSLRAYDRTFGKSVSMSAGTPVAEAALATGRAVTSIYSKVMNFRALDPRQTGQGQRNGGAGAETAWAEFWSGREVDRTRLEAAIAALEETVDGLPSDADDEPAIDDAEGYSPEGRRRLQTHQRIERNAALVNAAKARWRSEDLWLRCCVCSMSFLDVYGDLGASFIEAHHVIPLSALVEAKTPRIEDLAPVCANCHRMLHRREDVTIESLRSML